MTERWLEAMRAQGVVEARASLLRIVVADPATSDGAAVVDLAADNLEVLLVPCTWRDSHLTLPRLRWLLVHRDSLDIIVDGRSMPSLRKLSVGAVMDGSVPDWSQTCAASLRTLHLDYSTLRDSDGPGNELGGLDRLVSLRSLRIEGIYVSEMEAIFCSTMTAPAPAVTRLSLDFERQALDQEDGGRNAALVALGLGCEDAPTRLPGLIVLSMPFVHDAADVYSANAVLERMSQLLEDPATWPRLRRVEVGLATAHDEDALGSLPATCERRGIELVRMIECGILSCRPR